MQLNPDRCKSIHSFLKTSKMQLTSEQRIFRHFNEVQQLFEQRFRDGVSPTIRTIWKNVKKYKTERSTLNLNKNSSGCRRTERTQKSVNLLQEKLIEDSRISIRKKRVWTLVKTISQITIIAIWNDILTIKMYVRKYRYYYKWSWFTENK